MEKTSKKPNIFVHIVAMSKKKEKKSYPHYTSMKRKRIEQQLKELHITKTIGLDSITIHPILLT